jgi:hypothetical protein
MDMAEIKKNSQKKVKKKVVGAGTIPLLLESMGMEESLKPSTFLKALVYVFVFTNTEYTTCKAKSHRRHVKTKCTLH